MAAIIRHNAASFVVASSVPRNDKLSTPSGPEGSSGSSGLVCRGVLVGPPPF